HAVDPRTDLYAMGIMLYEMLTGQVPFQGKSAIAVIQQQLRGTHIPPRSIIPTLVPAWDEVLRRVLAEAPADRYPTAQALWEAVEAAWREQESLKIGRPAPPSVDELYAGA